MHNKRLKEGQCVSLSQSLDGKGQKGMWLEEDSRGDEYKVLGKREDEIIDRALKFLPGQEGEKEDRRMRFSTMLASHVWKSTF